MSIQSEIERISGNVASAYSVLSAKGATMPSLLNTANLASAIESIQAGEAMSIETVRLICGWQMNGLPVGYTLLEYIQSTGTQYIDTKFVPNSNTRIVADMEITAGATSFLFGARNNSSANATSHSFSMVQISGTSLRSDFGSVEAAVSVSPVQRLAIDKNKNSTTVNGTTITATAQTFQGSYPLALLAVNTAGTIFATKTSAKIYSCQIYDNGVLVRDYVPCINPSGETGLFDKVTKAFYGNAGTGVFTTKAY